MHFIDNFTCESDGNSFFASDRQLGMFEALGLKNGAEEIFSFEADFLSDDICVTNIQTGAVKTLALEDFFSKINSDDVQKLRSALSFISNFERRQLDMTIRVMMHGQYTSFRIRGMAFQREDRTFAVGLAYGNYLAESVYSRLEYLEKHDALTGLANASTLDAFVNESYRYSVSPQTLIVAKIDKFSEINDNFGYPAGNLLIKNVAKVIKECFFDAEMIARIGGGEYCAIYAGKSCLEVDNKIKQARMMLHGMYMNLIKTEVSFGYAVVNSAVSFCALYRQALQRMQRNRDLKTMLNGSTVIDSINSLVDSRLGWGKRTVRVQSLAAQVAAAMGCGEDSINEVKVLAKIADIGLIGVSESLLKRRLELSGQEQEEYMNHVEYGRDIISRVTELSFLQDKYMDIFKRYDEWKDAIPLSSCIVAAVRGFDDIVSAGEGGRAGDIGERFMRKRAAEYCPNVVDTIISIAGRHYLDGYGHTMTRYAKIV